MILLSDGQRAEPFSCFVSCGGTKSQSGTVYAYVFILVFRRDRLWVFNFCANFFFLLCFLFCESIRVYVPYRNFRSFIHSFTVHGQVCIQIGNVQGHFHVSLIVADKVTRHHHHHLSLNREGHWGTTDDFATSFLLLPLFSTAL